MSWFRGWRSKEACYSLCSAFNQAQILLSLGNNPGCFLKLEKDRESVCSSLKIDCNLPEGNKGNPTQHLHHRGGFQALAKEKEIQSEPKGLPELEKTIWRPKRKKGAGSHNTNSWKSPELSPLVIGHTLLGVHIRVSGRIYGNDWAETESTKNCRQCMFSTTKVRRAHTRHWEGFALTYQVTARTKTALDHTFKAHTGSK